MTRDRRAERMGMKKLRSEGQLPAPDNREGRRQAKALAKTKGKPERETVELIDGRIYWSPDNWQTIYATKRGNIGRTHIVHDKEEADMVRFLAVSQSSAGPS